MSAVIQSVAKQLATGSTTIQVGPPDHLIPSQVLDLRRANRSRRPAIGAGDRVAGTAVSGGSVDLGSAVPMTNTGTGRSRWGVRQEFVTAARISSNAIQVKTRTAVVAFLDAESDWTTIGGGLGEACDEYSP